MKLKFCVAALGACLMFSAASAAGTSQPVSAVMKMRPIRSSLRSRAALLRDAERELAFPSLRK